MSLLDKYFKYIVVGLLLVVIGRDFFSTDEGISPEEELYRLEIHDLNQDKIILKTELDSIKNRYEPFEKEVTADSVLIWDANRKYRDSIRAAINPR